MKTKLEVACFNEEAAIIAAKEGADRIELCENYLMGGVTPKQSTLQRLKKQFDVPVYVMIRPRGGDFNYTTEEFKLMKDALVELKLAGADGFVFGILTKDNKVDILRNTELVKLADGLPCTFHRAFDPLENKKKGLEEVISCGFTTVLTSGGEHPAIKGISKLIKLKEQAGKRITILVGGGVRSSNVGEMKKHFDFVHSACIKPGTEKIDLEEIRAVKDILSR